jgi:glycosyltransferase involved in cell wall biosynthesis
VRAAECLERTSYRAAKRIAVPTERLVGDLNAVREAEGKVALMSPAVDLDRVMPDEAPRNGALRVVYAGTVGMAHGLTTLVDAARIAGPELVHVTIAGDGAEAKTVAEHARKVRNVQLLGAVPSEEVPALYARSDVAAVLLRDKPLFRAALPTKLLEAMAAGRPLIVSAHGEAAELVGETGSGFAVPPEDPAALAEAMRRLAADRELGAKMGRAGRALAEARFGRDQSVDRWLELLESVSPR